MNINPTHNISFGTNVSSVAKKQIQEELSISKANKVEKFLKSDGFDDFTLKDKNTVVAYHPAYGDIQVSIADNIYKSEKPAEIARAITNAAIDGYSWNTGEYPAKFN